MRIIAALIYMIIGMWIYFQLGGGNLHPYIGVVIWLFLLLSSVIVCNEGLLRRLKRQTDNEYIQELLDKKLAIKESYKISEAITFEDLSTGCLCHILKVSEHSAICLYGQYLYDFSEIDDDPELSQERKFPTHEFELVRKTKNNEILLLCPGKTVLNDLRFEGIDVSRLHNLGIKLVDGEIIENISFFQIREACE